MYLFNSGLQEQIYTCIKVCCASSTGQTPLFCTRNITTSACLSNCSKRRRNGAPTCQTPSPWPTRWLARALQQRVPTQARHLRAACANAPHGPKHPQPSCEQQSFQAAEPPVPLSYLQLGCLHDDLHQLVLLARETLPVAKLHCYQPYTTPQTRALHAHGL